jgi:hypothetical protein
MSKPIIVMHLASAKRLRSFLFLQLMDRSKGIISKEEGLSFLLIFPLLVLSD